MLVEQAYDLISAHTTDDRALFLYASGAFQRLLGINSQVSLNMAGIVRGVSVRFSVIVFNHVFLYMQSVSRLHVVGINYLDSDLDAFVVRGEG